MRESLGKVSKKGTGTHIDLLSQEPDIVDDLCGLVHEFGGLVALPSEGESLDHPEGARDERALFELGAAIAIQQWSRAELLADRRNGRGEAVSTVESGPARQ